jgi:integrase
VWAIRFVNDDFKNKRTKKEGNYDIEFDDNMTDAIEHYLTNIRPKLQTLIEDNHEHSDPLVFVPSVGEIDSAAAEDKELEDVVSEAEEEGISRWLSHAFRKRTRLLPGCKGFGPHNARHLVATEYIKNEPGGIEVVSAVLHDKPETVRKHYAKYLPQDIAKHYIAHVVAHIRNRNGKASPERKYK